MITIGIPFFNAQNYLGFSIKSILNQSFKDFELILIDDGSTDRSLEVALSFKDSRIKVFSDGLNKKLPYRLNQIVELSEFPFIARMDADDICFANRMELQYKFLLDNDEVDLVSTGIVSFDNSGNFRGVRKGCLDITKEAALLGKTGIVHASVMGRRDWFKRNKYNPNNIQAEDYELWLKAALNNDLSIASIVEPLYCYREEGNVNKEKMLRGYRRQSEIIINSYEGVLSRMSCFIELIKIKSKEITVSMADFLGMMDVIYAYRIKDSGEMYKEEFERLLELICEK